MSSADVLHQSTAAYTNANTPTIPQSPPPPTTGDGGAAAKRGLFGRKKKSGVNLSDSPSTTTLASQTSSLLGSGGNGSVESLAAAGEAKKVGGVKSVFGRKPARVENSSAGNSIGSIDELGGEAGAHDAESGRIEDDEGNDSDDENE